MSDSRPVRAAEFAFTAAAIVVFGFVCARFDVLSRSALADNAPVAPSTTFEVLQHSDAAGPPATGSWFGADGAPGQSLRPGDRFVLVEDAPSFSVLWSALRDFLPDTDLPRTEPDVDFSTRSVLALLAFDRESPRHDIEVRRVSVDADTGSTTVVVHSSVPSPGCPAASASALPWQLVAFDRPSRAIAIEETLADHPCS